MGFIGLVTFEGEGLAGVATMGSEMGNLSSSVDLLTPGVEILLARWTWAVFTALALLGTMDFVAGVGAPGADALGAWCRPTLGLDFAELLVGLPVIFLFTAGLPICLFWSLGEL